MKEASHQKPPQERLPPWLVRTVARHMRIGSKPCHKQMGTFFSRPCNTLAERNSRPMRGVCMARCALISPTKKFDQRPHWSRTLNGPERAIKPLIWGGYGVLSLLQAFRCFEFNHLDTMASRSKITTQKLEISLQSKCIIQYFCIFIIFFLK